MDTATLAALAVPTALALLTLLTRRARHRHDHQAARRQACMRAHPAGRVLDDTTSGLWIRTATARYAQDQAALHPRPGAPGTTGRAEPPGTSCLSSFPHHLPPRPRTWRNPHPHQEGPAPAHPSDR